MENCNIKIYVVCHKPSYIPEKPIFVSYSGGSGIGKKRFANMLYDDVGN